MGRPATWVAATAATVLFQAAALRGQEAAAGAAPALGYAEVLARCADLDRLWRPPLPGERGLQFSSYDRRSHAGPADVDAWYGNSDRGQYLRIEERDGRKEFVMVDQAGSGLIARIWSANPSGTLRFYFDGADQPGWTIDHAALLGGRIEGLGEPLCGTRARGGNCHLPIPFAEHVKVTCDTGDFYYQVGVRLLGEGERALSFRGEWLVEHRRDIARFGARLGAGAAAAASLELSSKAAGTALADAAEAGELWRLERQGSGVVRALRLGLSRVDVRPEVVARGLRVVVEVDGERTVDVPFGDFFGSAIDAAPWAGRALGMLDDGTGYCLLPMPFLRSLRIMLVADDVALRGGEVRYAVTIAEAAAGFGVEPLRFHASWHQQRGLSTRPYSDHLVLDAQGGAGRFVGCGLVIRNPTKAWWGEGDERIVVDGEPFPSTFGTGTEDYFGYAWCCPERFDSPLHAQPSCDGPANYGRAHNVRLQLHDNVPFTDSLRFDFEVWHWRDVEIDYATTAWWYGARGVRAGLPKVPPVAERELAPLEPPQVFRAAGALEGEALTVLANTGGTLRHQDMSGFSGQAKWSGESHLWWTGAKPGDRLTLAVPVERAGRYRVEAVFTTARDYGRVKVILAGQAIGGETELYTAEVSHTGVVTLGEMRLEAGAQPLVVEITGHHPRAVPAHMFGLDYLRLVALDG